MLPYLSIVIVNWNTADLLRDCLRSLAASTVAAGTEIIVVDNGSADDSAAMVHREFPTVRLIANRDNVGYTRANNQGLAASEGRYVLLLNSDTLVPPYTLAALLAFMERFPQVGACSPQLLRPDGLPQAFAFGSDPTPPYLLRRGLARLIVRRPLHNWDVRHPLRVDWVSGACLLLRRAALVQSGPLDEAIFMYFEDNDLCRRLRQCGWQVVYYPRVAITHIGGQSLAKNPRARRAYRESLRHFYRKHYGPLAQCWLASGLWVYERLMG
ncbi:MAG: glycosyltransferase family 2 protein [Chloroflexaceae bacterium]|nr:glycosyltransferase family 2 protein [Chloroflexaceae bacterium]NJO06236.1 glycosyltransferase family 2 protein [Chloroflexaceae bacterium]